MIITNLFYIFDSSLFLAPFPFFIIILLIILIVSFFWPKGQLISIVLRFFSGFKSEVDHVISNPKKGCYIFIISIFISLSLYNFIAMFPHIFSFTSHLIVTLPISYSLWVGVIVFRVCHGLKFFLAHLIPTGTPTLLIRFISLVELLSNLIRPLALTFRLTANMMAGHLLLSLIVRAMLKLSFLASCRGSLVRVLLVFIELGVSLIQAYVFSVLLLLYLSQRRY